MNTVCYLVLTNENGPHMKQRVDVYAGVDAVDAAKTMMKEHFKYDSVNIDHSNIDRVIAIEHLLNQNITILPMLNWGDLVAHTARLEYETMKKKVMDAIR